MIFHIDAIDLDRSTLHIVEAWEHIGDRCLARTAGANQCCQLSGFDSERNVFQYRGAPVDEEARGFGNRMLRLVWLFSSLKPAKTLYSSRL